VVDGLGSINDSIRVFEAHPTFISFDLLATDLKDAAFLIGFYLLLFFGSFQPIVDVSLLTPLP
jgi:hypothetical protein